MYEFRMPSLGADMESGVLLAWEVKPGARVERGEVIATVGTEKGDIGAEVYADGILTEILVEEGMEVPVGTLLALVRTEEGEEIPAPAVMAEEKEKAAVPVAEPAVAIDGQKVAAPVAAEAGERVRISPVARKLAAELGIELGSVRGTGPHGAISRSDIEQAHARQAAARRVAGERAVEARPPVAEAPPPVREEAAAAAPARAPAPDFQTGMRQAIARAMARSNREIPHYYLETRIDMSRALAWLEAENLQRPIAERILPVVVMLKAVARALADVPELNGYWADDRHQPQEAIHIGFAIALRQGGLITPALHHVDLKSLTELMEALRDLITRTREGRLRSSEMTDATITVTNLGDLGVETVYGVIYPPQVALVGLGKIAEQPWVENGMIGIRPVMTATLAGDHRATDGRRGAQFLTALNRYLQEPEQL